MHAEKIALSQSSGHISVRRIYSGMLLALRREGKCSQNLVSCTYCPFLG